jgi:hypothetical protein
MKWVPINVITDNVITFLQVQENVFLVATDNWLSDKKRTPIMLSFSFRSIITDNVITFLQVQEMFFFVATGNWLSDKKWTPIMLSFSFHSVITDNVITFLQVPPNEKMFFYCTVGGFSVKSKFGLCYNFI